jgi:hypothetical protein
MPPPRSWSATRSGSSYSNRCRSLAGCCAPTSSSLGCTGAASSLRQPTIPGWSRSPPALPCSATEPGVAAHARPHAWLAVDAGPSAGPAAAAAGRRPHLRRPPAGARPPAGRRQQAPAAHHDRDDQRPAPAASRPGDPPGARPRAAGRLATATGEQLDIDTLTAKGNRSHERTAGIAADSRPPEEVRRVLLDTLALPDWNPAFRAIDGPAPAATAVGYPTTVRPGLTGHFEYAAIGPHRYR